MNQQPDSSLTNNDINQKAQPRQNISFYSKNRFKIFGLLLSITLVFSFIIIVINVFLLSNTSASNVFGGVLVLTLIRIAFLILGPPVSIILVFIGHRIDDAQNKAAYRYPIWVELIGMFIGIYLGLDTAILWIVSVSVSQGLIWANPILYIPFLVITPIITYLCLKGTQLIYSLVNKRFRGDSFKLLLIIFLLSSPFLIYSGYSLFQIHQQESSQTSITITDFKAASQGKIYTANISIPQADEYNITATIGFSSPAASAGILRLNGIENIDGLNNYELTTGINKLIYYPNTNACPVSNSSTIHSVTFEIRKVLANQLKVGNPKIITEPITCNQSR